jgi:hypothetical protein
LRPSRLISELPQCLQVPDVEWIGGDSPAALDIRRLLRLDQDRPALTSWIVEQSPEGLEAKTSGPDVLMAIDTASAGTLRVVPVQHPQPIEAHELVERLERQTIAIVTDDVVAAGDEVAGVKTHAGAWRAVEKLEHSSEMLETMADGA